MILELEKLVEYIYPIRTSLQAVLANGVFDILHVGHIRYLRIAKMYGDILIVAVNDDNSVRKLKGKDRPLIPCNERMEIINSLEFVDYVVPFSELSVVNIIKNIKPDFHAKGTDYTINTVPEKKEVEGYGGKVIICGDPKDHSSTEIIEKSKKFLTNK